MAIIQAGKTFTATELKSVAGNIASAIQQATIDGAAYRGQLETWTNEDLVDLGLTLEEVNAIKGFYVGDLPGITTTLQGSTWYKQLLGTGV